MFNQLKGYILRKLLPVRPEDAILMVSSRILESTIRLSKSFDSIYGREERIHFILAVSFMQRMTEMRFGQNAKRALTLLDESIVHLSKTVDEESDLEVRVSEFRAKIGNRLIQSLLESNGSAGVRSGFSDVLAQFTKVEYLRGADVSRSIALTEAIFETDADLILLSRQLSQILR